MQEGQDLKGKLQGAHISVCAVAPPAVVSRDLAEGCGAFVTSIVCGVRALFLDCEPAWKPCRVACQIWA